MGGEARCQFTVKPTKTGEQTLSVMFDSREMEDVDGMLTVTVTETEKTPVVPVVTETGMIESLALSLTIYLIGEVVVYA